MAIVGRKIEVTFSYAAETSAPKKTVTLRDHRASVTAVIAGGVGMGQLQLRIFGLTLSMMNELSTLGQLPNAFRQNMVLVRAGDEDAVLSQIYAGTIIAAWADMMSAPDVAFNVTGSAGAIEALMPVPPTSYPSTVDVAVAMSNLAAQMGLLFENNGVSVILSTQYLPGTARDQALRLVENARIEWNGGENGVLAIWPRGGSRKGLIPLISPKTGMVGYPTYNGTGIVVTTIFDPTITFGGQVKVESSLTPACGVWTVVSLLHDIEAEVPGGRWFTQMQLAAPGTVVVAR